MLLKYFYDNALAHASYLVGCQRTNEALIIDPGRDVTPYLELAQKEGMKIVGAAETHIHADYVSGARELAERTGAVLYLSDEGPEEWKYQFVDAYEAQLLCDGDSFMIGNIKLQTLFTPGHTPESISFILTDLGGGADRPMGIFTGDFVFVGSTGRPDLLEKAAGESGTAVHLAQQMYQSLLRFKQLPDYLQVWPAHGAGSACGKGLGAVPSSTVGYEKLFNPALSFTNEGLFVDYLLADQPEPPTYFAMMKRINKEGPQLLRNLSDPQKGDVPLIKTIIEAGCLVIDTNFTDAFAQAHVSGTINIPMANLAQWAGWMVDYESPTYLITSENSLSEAVRILRKIGVDQLPHYFEAAEVAAAGLMTESYETCRPEEIADLIENGEMMLIDVRNQTEWNERRLPNADHMFLGKLQETAAALTPQKPVVVQCRSGARSAIGASILQAANIKNVTNLTGGIIAWEEKGLPVIS